MSKRSWQRRLIPGGALVCLLVATSFPACADEAAKPTVPEGYKLVPVKNGSKTSYLMVKDESNPFSHAPAPAGDSKYHPELPDFSATSAMANKSFMTSASSLTRSDRADNQNSFSTSSYFAGKNDPTSAAFNKTYAGAKNATGFDQASNLQKSYVGLSASSLAKTDAALAQKTSSYAGQAATLGSGHTDIFASTLARPFQDPDLKIVKHEGATQADNQALSLKDLPNRPLTIDEVRALINNGTKPDTYAPPEPTSKPLNDPSYVPDAPPAIDSTPAPISTPPKPGQDDLLPAPGALGLSADNSEPLPTK